LVDQSFCPVNRHSQRAEQQIALEDTVDLDLPIASNETPSVSRHDLDLVILVSELGGAVIPPSGSMLKLGVSSDTTNFYCLDDSSSPSEIFLRIASPV
jgi:hypothetical protein